MVVDPQRGAEIPSGGEPAEGMASIDALMAKAEAEANAAIGQDAPPEAPEPPEGAASAPSGESTSDEGASDSGGDDDDPFRGDPEFDALFERLPGESRQKFAQRVKDLAADAVRKADEARAEADELRQRADEQTQASRRHVENLEKWLLSDADYAALKEKAYAGDYTALDQLREVDARREYRETFDKLAWGRIGLQMETAAEQAGLPREAVRSASGFEDALRRVVDAATRKVVASKDAEITTLTGKLEAEQSAHRTTRDKLAGRTAASPIAGGRAASGGVLSGYLGTDGLPTDEAIQAAIEGRLSGLTLEH